jgi:hypothetical protein
VDALRDQLAGAQVDEHQADAEGIGVGVPRALRVDGGQRADQQQRTVGETAARERLHDDELARAAADDRLRVLQEALAGARDDFGEQRRGSDAGQAGDPLNRGHGIRSVSAGRRGSLHFGATVGAAAARIGHHRHPLFP